MYSRPIGTLTLIMQGPASSTDLKTAWSGWWAESSWADYVSADGIGRGPPVWDLSAGPQLARVPATGTALVGFSGTDERQSAQDDQGQDRDGRHDNVNQRPLHNHDPKPPSFKVCCLARLEAMRDPPWHPLLRFTDRPAPVRALAAITRPPTSGLTGGAGPPPPAPPDPPRPAGPPARTPPPPPP